MGAARSALLRIGAACLLRACLLCACLLCACLLTACTEREPSEPVAAASAAAAAFACDEASATQSAAPAELRRLTMTQYRNALRDLTRWALQDESEVASVLATLDEALAEAPLDRRANGSYRRLDQALDQAHVDAAFRVGTTLSAALTQPSRLVRVVGACATDSDAANDEACLVDFIHRFGARALRRPLESDDEAFYRMVYGLDAVAQPAAYAELITVMLNAPELLYFVEHGDAPVPDSASVHSTSTPSTSTYALSAHELASRLSFHFWQTQPDDELWQRAHDGSLLEPDVLAQQVERLIADPRARETMSELFADWLELDELPVLHEHAGDPVYAAFAGADQPSPELRQHMIDDVLDMLGHIAFTEPAGVEALLTSERSFARTEDLARIYQVPPWDGATAPPLFPAGQRPGLLTRARFLTSGSANTRPIMKGVLVRRQLLCDELAPPLANANALPPELHSDMTTRQVVEELTEQEGTACASCHSTQINPLGFALEGFDALGRVRTEQRLFDASGSELPSQPIDTRSVPRITPDDDSTSEGPVDLMQLMLQSGKVEACLARNYFRFTFGRNEDLSRDGCALERLRARLTETDRIRDMLIEAALLPELRRKTFD